MMSESGNNQQMCFISMWEFHILSYMPTYFDYILVAPVMLLR